MKVASDIKTLHQVAQSLLCLSEQIRAFSQMPGEGKGLPTHEQLIENAEKIYRHRRKRVNYFDESLFGEPAWDLLLDLFIQGERGKPVSVSSACLGAAVPTTTALRWISTLMSKGLLCRVTDCRDGRRSILKLTSEGRLKMLNFLEKAF